MSRNPEGSARVCIDICTTYNRLYPCGLSIPPLLSTPTSPTGTRYYPMAVGSYWVFRQTEPHGTTHQSRVEVVATQ